MENFTSQCKQKSQFRPQIDKFFILFNLESNVFIIHALNI